MMPVFFNVASHLWIVYLFFLNGLLLNWVLRNFSENYYELTRSLESQALAAFLISISINGFVLLSLDVLSIEFIKARIIFSILTGVLLVYAALKIRDASVLSAEYSLYRIALYLFVFVVLFYNGGLIERIADSWWHMSYANKIAYHNSYSLEVGHLDGVTKRFYPPLWHGNLALMTTMSGIQLPVIWNSFTAWGGVLKVMAYYLFAYALTGDKKTGFLGALLFILLPGLHNSYLRVSAWPSHIGYIQFFVTLFVVFKLVDLAPLSQGNVIVRLWKMMRESGVYFFILWWLAVMMASTHMIELVWLFIGLMVYSVALWISRIWNSSPYIKNSRDVWVMNCFGVIGLLIVLILSVKLLYVKAFVGNADIDTVIALGLPVTLGLIWLLLIYSANKEKWLVFSKLTTVAMFVVLLFTIDYTQLISLFNPEFDMRIQRANEQSFMTEGRFGGMLQLPSWNFQLRAGLLYSGILSIPLAMYLAAFHASRATLFLVAGSFTALFLCISPYFYEWLRSLLGYGSTWRVTLLIFHPIILAVFVRLLAKKQWKVSF